MIRGFEAIRKRIAKSPRAYMSCMCCGSFYQAVGDKTDVCQNPAVLEYDMIIEPHRIYCLRWTPTFDERKLLSEDKITKARTASR